MTLSELGSKRNPVAVDKPAIASRKCARAMVEAGYLWQGDGSMTTDRFCKSLTQARSLRFRSPCRSGAGRPGRSRLHFYEQEDSGPG
jgi:hypothetical protein